MATRVPASELPVPGAALESCDGLGACATAGWRAGTLPGMGLRIFQWLLVAMLTGCGGTMLTEVQTGYVMSPSAEGIEHGADITGHIGGSSAPNLGIGLSLRARGMTNGFAVPELGPHVFVLLEDDRQVAFYARAHPMVGFGMVGDDLGPLFSAVLNPGVLFYPADDPLFLSVSLTGDLTMAPVGNHVRGWVGLQLGFGVGGVDDRR